MAVEDIAVSAPHVATFILHFLFLPILGGRHHMGNVHLCFELQLGVSQECLVCTQPDGNRGRLLATEK